MADVHHGKAADDKEQIRSRCAERGRLDVRSIGEAPKLQVRVIDHNKGGSHASEESDTLDASVGRRYWHTSADQLAHAAMSDTRRRHLLE